MIFHKLVDTTGYKKTKEYIFKFMDNVIGEIGKSLFIQIVMDNETSFKAVGKMLMNKREHLYWIPCISHYIDLMLEDIRKIKGIREIIGRGRVITSLTNNSTQAVNILRSYIEGHD